VNTTLEILEDIRAGRMVILVDDESRENEGDLILPADFVTPQAINFMAKEARGLICLALTGQQIEKLQLPMMAQDERNGSPNKTAFTVSIEAASGVSTGISAADRAHTVRVAANPAAQASDVIIPGHIFPIRARDGGVLKRAGHTEASVDLCRLAGLNPSAVICEIMNEDGTMARWSDLKVFAEKFQIKIGSIEDLIAHRLLNESFVEEVVDTAFPTELGQGFRMKLFRNTLDGREHVVLYKGSWENSSQPILVRVHTENVLADVFASSKSSSRRFFEESVQMIDRAGVGVLVYLKQEDMDQRLERRLSVFKDLEKGDLNKDSYRSAFGSDQKEYGVGAQILRALGLQRIALISNNLQKKVGLKGYGIEIVDVVQIESRPSESRYQERSGHA
jgi:3,4-dihydroxy 2-butanone 4-phosphate synthase / GTP cyclohydrolase II